MPHLQHEGEVAPPVQPGVVVELVEVVPGSPGSVVVSTAVVVVNNINNHRSLGEVAH